MKFKNLFVTAFSALIYFLLFTGLLFVPFLQSFAALVLPFCVGAAVIFTVAAAWNKSGKAFGAVITLWLTFLLLFTVFFNRKISGGLAAVINGVIDLFKKIHPKNYEVFSDGNYENSVYVLLVLAVIIAFWALIAVRRHRGISMVVSLVLLSAEAAVFLHILPFWWFVLFALFGLVMFSLGFILNRQSTFYLALGSFVRSAARSAVIFILTAFVLGGMLRSDKPQFLYFISQTVQNTVQNLRYGISESAGLTGGNLHLSARKSGGETKLSVTMQSPKSCYLRGFVGEVYQNNLWSPLSNEVLYKNAGLFNSLHQNGFFAQSQLSAAAEAADVDLKDEGEIKIENIGLPSNYIYTPYLLTADAEVLDKKAIGDSTVFAEGIRGQRSYSYKAYSELVTVYSKIETELYNKQNLKSVQKYLKNEAAYNNFVYRQYTDLPQDIDSFLYEKLGNYSSEKDRKHFDYRFAKQNILYYLTNNIKYDESAATTENGVDFILNFLDGTRRGYDVHYASAAVMMFRYYGIPARYCEGYVVTKNDAADMQSGDTLKLDATHAHAWAEYYEDGVGWLPFEATPNYLSLMEQDENYKDISGLVGSSDEQTRKNAIQPETMNEKTESSLLVFLLKNRLLIVLVLAALLALGLLLAFLFWLFKQRKKTAYRKAQFYGADRRQGVLSAFSYIADLLKAEGVILNNRPAEEYEKFLDDDLKKAYIKAVAIWQQAKFSRTNITEEQQKTVASLSLELWQRIYKKAGFLKRLKLKYMYFL